MRLCAIGKILASPAAAVAAVICAAVWSPHPEAAVVVPHLASAKHVCVCVCASASSQLHSLSAPAFEAMFINHMSTYTIACVCLYASTYMLVQSTC